MARVRRVSFVWRTVQVALICGVHCVACGARVAELERSGGGASSESSIRTDNHAHGAGARGLGSGGAGGAQSTDGTSGEARETSDRTTSNGVEHTGSMTSDGDGREAEVNTDSSETESSQTDAPEATGEAEPTDACVARTPASVPEEAARALAFTLWGGEPDAALEQAAQQGELATPEGLTAHARRMLEAPRARRHFGGFGPWWLGLDPTDEWIERKAEWSPGFDRELWELMVDQVHMFTEDVFYSASGSVQLLLTAPYTFVESRLAELYGVEVDGGDFVRVEFEPIERVGLFTHSGFLTATSAEGSNPARRGFALLERLFCQVITPPEHSDLADFEARQAGQTTRQYYEEVVSPEPCASCHRFGTAMGFAFESYDALGRYRTEELGLPVDTRATVPTLDRPEYANAREMLTALLADRSVLACVATHLQAYMLGRDVEDVVRSLSGLVLEERDQCLALSAGAPSASPAAPIPPASVPCRSDLTFSAHAVEETHCAGRNSMNLQELVVALATSNRISNRSFACGNMRCLSEVEYCASAAPREPNAETNPGAFCKPYPEGGGECRGVGVLGEGCTCEMDDRGNATVRCAL